MGNPTPEKRDIHHEEVSEKALGWSVNGARRNMDPRTARDADMDLLVLEGVPTINFGRGVPDPTPTGAMAEDRMGRLKRMVRKLTPSVRKRDEETKQPDKKPALVEGPKSYWNRTAYGGDEAVAIDQAQETEYHRFLASQDRWNEIHNDHYDWWMFPIDRGSAAYGDFYNVAGEPLERLKGDVSFLDSLAEAIEIQARANGWSLYERNFIQDPKWEEGQDWTKAYPTRIWKMTRSAQIFGLREEFESLKLMQRSLEASGIRFNHRKYWNDPGTVDDVPQLSSDDEDYFFSHVKPQETKPTTPPSSVGEQDKLPIFSDDAGDDSVWSQYDNFEFPTDPALMRAEEFARLMDDREGSDDPGYPYLHIPRDDRMEISDTIFFGISLLPSSLGDDLSVDRAETAQSLEEIVRNYDLYEDDRYAVEGLIEVLRDPDLLDDFSIAGNMSREERLNYEVNELMLALRKSDDAIGGPNPYASVMRDERMKMADALDEALSLLSYEADGDLTQRRLEMAERLKASSVWWEMYDNDSRSVRKLASALVEKAESDNEKSSLPMLSPRAEINLVRAFTPADPKTGVRDRRTYFISPLTAKDELTQQDAMSVFEAARNAGLGGYKARGHKVPKILGPVFYEFAEPMVGRGTIERAVQATFPKYGELVEIGALNAIGMGRAADLIGVEDGDAVLRAIETGKPVADGQDPVFVASTTPSRAHYSVERTPNFLLLTASLIPGVDVDKLRRNYGEPDLLDFDNEYFSSIRFNESHPLVSHAKNQIKKHRQYEEDYKDWAQRWASSVYDMMRRSGMSGSEIADTIHRRWAQKGYISTDPKPYAQREPSGYLAHMADLMFSTLGDFYAPVHKDSVDDTGLLLPMHEFFHSYLGQGITRHGEYAAFRGPWEVYDSWSLGFSEGWAANRRFAYRVLAEEAALRGVKDAPDDVFKMIRLDIEKRLKQMLEDEQEIRKIAFLFPEYLMASSQERERLKGLITRQLVDYPAGSITQGVEVIPPYLFFSPVDGFSPRKEDFPFGGEDRLGSRMTYVDKTGKQGRIQ